MFFFPLFRFFNCYSLRHRDIISFPACVRFDILCMERYHFFFLSLFFPSWIATIDERNRIFTLETVRTISPQLSTFRYMWELRFIRREHFHNAAFSSTARVSIILSRIIIAVARPNYSSWPLSGIRDSLCISSVKE